MRRFEFREDTTGSRKLIKNTLNEKYKSRNDFLWRHHHNKRLEQLYSFELLKENSCASRKFSPDFNGKETPEEKKQ